MDFVMSFSCGKDSMYALHQMVEAGHRPVALVVACSSSGRSFLHGADERLLDLYAETLGIPLIRTCAGGEDYALRFEEGLKEAKKLGAEAVCFGDIGSSESKEWNESRALAAGLRPLFPLWMTDRESHVAALIEKGYKCIIKVVDTHILPAELLGRALDHETARRIKVCGADVCGENGEYHTLVVDGPLFTTGLSYETGAIAYKGQSAYIEMIF